MLFIYLFHLYIENLLKLLKLQKCVSKEDFYDAVIKNLRPNNSPKFPLTGVEVISLFLSTYVVFSQVQELLSLT